MKKIDGIGNALLLEPEEVRELEKSRRFAYVKDGRIVRVYDTTVQRVLGTGYVVMGYDSDGGYALVKAEGKEGRP